MRNGAVAVLGLVATFALASATLSRGQDRAVPGATKADLRARYTRLWAEVELLQVEHEAGKASILEAMKGTSDSQIEEQAKKEMSQVEMLAMQVGKLDDFRKEFGEGESREKKVVEMAKEYAVKVRAELDHTKGEFVKRAVMLAEKKLDLSEAEARYRGAN